MSWRFFFKDNVLEGAQTYIDNGAIRNYKQVDNLITADVDGMETYHVRITLYPSGGRVMQCTCPLAQNGQRCKHMAAVMLKWDELQSKETQKRLEEQKQERLLKYKQEKKDRGRHDIITGELIEGDPIVYRLENVGRILSSDPDKKEIYDSTTDGYGYLKEETLQKIVEITADRRDYVWQGSKSTRVYFRIFIRLFTSDKALIVNLVNRLYASVISVNGNEIRLQSCYMCAKHVVGRLFRDLEKAGVKFSNLRVNFYDVQFGLIGSKVVDSQRITEALELIDGARNGTLTFEENDTVGYSEEPEKIIEESHATTSQEESDQQPNLSAWYSYKNVHVDEENTQQIEQDSGVNSSVTSIDGSSVADKNKEIYKKLYDWALNRQRQRQRNESKTENKEPQKEKVSRPRGDDSHLKGKKQKQQPTFLNNKLNSKTPEGKLKKRILHEFPNKKLLGDIQISDEEFELILDHFQTQYRYMRITGEHLLVDPVLCVALIQIGIRYYDGAFWPHVKELLDDPKFNVNQQAWIGSSFIETLKHYDKIQASETDRVACILMHGFVSDFYAEKFFDFLYAFYKIDLDRDISRLDRETMSELISIIKKNDNSGRTYNVMEHTADAVRRNERGAKIRIRRYLKLIDKAFWGDDLPQSSNNRIIRSFLEWKDTAAEFVQERRQQGAGGKRGKKSFATPYLKYDGKNDCFKLILPAQIIRFEDFSALFWEIQSENISERIEINPYAQGVTGYKTEAIEVNLSTKALFDGFVISLINGDEKLRTFRITKDPIRFFDEEGDYIRCDSLQGGRVYSFSPSGFEPQSEAVIECFDSGELVRCAYDFVKGDIIRIPDGKPITVGGKLNEGILPRGVIGGVIAGKYKDNKPVYRDIPSIFIKMLPQRAIGTAVKVNGNVYRFASEDALSEGISEFDLMDRSGAKGYLIELSKFGCVQDGEYSISIDVPNDRTIRNWKYVLISHLEYEFEEAPYIFKTRGTLSIPNQFSFEAKNDVQVELQDRRRFNFDIVPGEERIYLAYKGIDIGFEIPTLSYKFHGEEWHTGPHIDIWHGDFDPRLFVTYNADRIKIFLDDIGDENDDEHVESFAKNKSKGLFDCDLNRFKSWFGREKQARQIFLELPGVEKPIPFVRVITQSTFVSSVLRADFSNHKLIADFDIVGYSEYYVDIEFGGQKIAEKLKLTDKHLEMESELKTGIYSLTVFEAEEDEYGFGFGDAVYYEIGSAKTELLNPDDLSGLSVEVKQIHAVNDASSFLPLGYRYLIVDLKHSDEISTIYHGKMIVVLMEKAIATFPVSIEFYDKERLQQAYVTFLEEEENVEFLYDEYQKKIVKQEAGSISKSEAYRRYKYSLFPEDYLFELKFVERPRNAEAEVDDAPYNNTRQFDIVKTMMKESIFGKK